MNINVKTYEEMFISTLDRRLKTVKEKRKHYAYMKKSIQFVYSIAVLIFTAIGIFIAAMSDSKQGHVPYIGLVIYEVCGVILLGLMIFLLYYMEANISYYDKRISDLELRAQRIEHLRLINEQFSDIEIGFSNDWFLNSLKEVNRFNREDFTFHQDRDKTINLIKKDPETINTLIDNNNYVVMKEPFMNNNITEPMIMNVEEGKPNEFDLIRDILSKKLS